MIVVKLLIPQSVKPLDDCWYPAVSTYPSPLPRPTVLDSMITVGIVPDMVVGNPTDARHQSRI